MASVLSRHTVTGFPVGTAVTLDKGYLEFSEVTLTAYSAAGDTYQFTGQVAGALTAPLGQGGRIVAAYTNVDGQSAGEDLLWQNPTNFNGTLAVQHTATANAATLRLALTAVLDAGHLGFGDFALQRLAAGDVIRRSTYMLAGQAVAVRVSGDPDGNDGLHYLYSDHLGSASAMQKDDGSAPIITRYTPFGGYRASSGPNEVTDRGFTGQSENMSLGLYYYQARFFVPGIGRFASADTIIPDPANPQSYNRYSYVENRPLVFTDPTGHCAENADESCWSLAENLWARYNNLDEMLSLDYLGSLDYMHLRLLDTLLAPEIQEIYSQYDTPISTIASMAENLYKRFNPMRHEDEMDDDVWAVAMRMKNEYARQGIDLARIAIEDNPLDWSKIEFDEIGNVDLKIAYSQNDETFLFLERLRLENINPLTNYEMNYLQALVNHRPEVALSVQVDIILQTAIPGYWISPKIYSEEGEWE